MAAAPTNLLLAQNFTTDLNSLGRANSPAIPGGQPPGGPAHHGLQFQTREEAQMFLQAAGRAQPNGANPGGIALNRDAVAALQHAAQVAAVNQAKLVPHGPGSGANGSIRPAVPLVPPLGQGQNPALANLHTQAQLQAAMNAQRAAQAAAQQAGGLSAANNQAALFLVQNQLAQAQAQAASNAAQNNPFGLQNGLQNNPIAAAAAAAAAVAATTQAAQARAAAVGSANQLQQLQLAAQAAGLQRPQAMAAWAQNQALQNAAIAQHNLAQQNMAATQNNPALLAAALQAQQARAALQVQQLAQQQAAAAAARPLNPQPQGNVAAAQHLQVLRQLQARLNAAQAPNPLVAAAAAPAAAKPTEAQLQALRSALARTTAGRNANLNAATVLGANAPGRNAVPQGNGAPAAPALNPLQQAINLQLLLQQQQRTAAQVQQVQQVTAMANNLANIQNNAAAAALNGQLAALQQAAAANGQRQLLPGGAVGLAGMAAAGGGGNAAGLTEAMLQNLQKMQLAKAMQDSVAAVTGMSVPQVDKVPPGGDASAAAASNSSKEQRRLALACVALQLARGGMTVEQAIQSGIMGGMSVTDVKFIVECYNAERQRMQTEGVPGAGANNAGNSAGPGAPPQAGANLPQPGGGAPADMAANMHAGGMNMPTAANGGGGMPGLHGQMQGHADLGMHVGALGAMAGVTQGMPGHHPNGVSVLHFAQSPSAPASPALSELPKDGPPSAGGSALNVPVGRMGPVPIAGVESAPMSPSRAASQGSPVQRGRLTAAGSEADGATIETRSEGGTSAELAADAAATVAVLAKEPFDAFSYAFFGAPEGNGMGDLMGELETGADGELEPDTVAPLDAAELEANGAGSLGGADTLSGLGELDPDQAAWLRAAASANQAMWAGEGAEDGPMSNDEIAARLANLDLGSGFF